jgi:hypothetical protein
MGGECSTHGEMRNAYRIVFLGSQKVRDLLEDLSVDGTIILKWTLRKQGGRFGLDLSD